MDEYPMVQVLVPGTVGNTSSDPDNDRNVWSTQVDWELADSLVMEWNDGHIPESLTCHSACGATTSSQTTTQTPKQYIRIYPNFHSIPACYRDVENSTSENAADSCASSSFVHCIDSAFPLDLADAIYQYTTHTNQPHKTWGTYVTIKDIQNYWKSNCDSIKNVNRSTLPLSSEEQGIQCEEDKKNCLNSIAIPAAAYFMKNYDSIYSAKNGRSACPNLFQCSSNVDQTTQSKESTETPDTKAAFNINAPSDRDISPSSAMDEAHGIAIWALASDIGSEVPYHIDYAELLRYETGTIVPPIIAGTWHCTPNPNYINFRGGNYRVLSRGNGLDHYNKHGYKGKLQPVDAVAFNPDSSLTGNVDGGPKSSDFLELKYKWNRMICQSGHLPHWSTRVEAPVPIEATTTSNNKVVPCVRVVVGFNVFMPDVGPIIQQAPEHSDAFRRRVKANRNKIRNLSIHAFTNNPQLRRALVLAKREKYLNDFKCRQKDLDDRILEYLRSRKSRVTVAELLGAFSPSETTNQWPYDVSDVHVHIHSICKKGTLRATGVYDSGKQLPKLIGKDCFIEVER